jgi:hypothetical protein
MRFRSHFKGSTEQLSVAFFDFCLKGTQEYTVLTEDFFLLLLGSQVIRLYRRKGIQNNKFTIEIPNFAAPKELLGEFHSGCGEIGRHVRLRI